jgi:CheY-like chemotaxis protein
MNSNTNILIVDDDERNIFALSAVLKSRNFIVNSVTDGKAAIDYMAKSNTIDIILMDIMMPLMDGFQAIKILRNQDVNINIPIIALTAKAMQGDRENCISAGADDYCSKPVDIDELILKIETLLI